MWEKKRCFLEENTRIILVTHKEIWTRALCWYQTIILHLPTHLFFFTPTSIFLFLFPLFLLKLGLFCLQVNNDYSFASCSDIWKACRSIGLLLSSDPYNYPQQTKRCQWSYSCLGGNHGMKIFTLTSLTSTMFDDWLLFKDTWRLHGCMGAVCSRQ